MDETPELIVDDLIVRASEFRREGRNDEARELYDSEEVQAVIARLVGIFARRKGQHPGEFTGIAYEQLWNKLKEFDGKRRFAPWAATVVKNKLVDALRADGTRRKHVRSESDLHIPDESPGPVKNALDSNPQSMTSFDFDEEFSPSDLDVLRDLRLEHRIFLLVLYGLWKGVPQNEWRDWLEEIGMHDVDAFNQQLDNSDERTRINLIADVLGLDQINAAQWTKRRKHLIVWLDWFWSVTFDRYIKFSELQVKELLESASVVERIVITCLTPNWFRAPSLQDFVEIVDLPERRRDFPWLQFLEEREPTRGNRTDLLAREPCGIQLDRNQLEEIWDNQRELRSRLVVR